MQMYELSIILDLLEYTYREEWEQTRILGYITAQTQSTKKISPKDIMIFPWDKEEKKNTKVSNEDRERLINKIKALEKKE